MTQEEINSALQDILLPSSNEILAERFSAENQAAASCNGKCKSGTCMGSV